MSTVPHQRAYPVRVLRDVLIPMRDGTRLAANVYLPEGAGPVPAILQYTPYLKDGHGGRGQIEIGQLTFARRGYATVSLDMRGFGASDGDAAPPFSASEAQDGYDALAWLAEQEWCSGQTGMWGISYGGDTSLAVAATRPPSLRAIVPIHATEDEFTGALYPRGCRGGLWSENDWGFRMVGLQLLPPLRLGNEARWQRLWRDRLDRLMPWPLTWHTIPPATWATWRADCSKIQAATYLVSAWHDCYPLETFRAADAIAAPKRVLIGPWKHELPDFAVNGPIGFFHEMARWWDAWLLAVDNGIQSEPPVTVYHQPAGGWHAESAWPPSGAEVVDFFFDAGGVLARNPLRLREDDTGVDNHRVDPTVGLAHLPWDWTTPASLTALDLAPDDHRALTYTTAALPAAMDVRGNPEVVVFLAADQPDFPLAIWLADVAPNGFSTLICQGWLRPTHQVGELLRSDHIYELRVRLNPTSYRLAAGHRLRVALSGADFPKLISAPTNPLLAVRRSPSHPSRLRLPIGLAASGGPMFTPATTERPEAMVEGRAEHAITRDLLDRTAGYRNDGSAAYRLEGGTTLRMNLKTAATIDRERPENVSFHGAQTIVVERPVNTIVVRTEALETFDHLRIAATITLDGRPYFERSWELDLAMAAWSLKAQERSS
jgi:uncharacterized protein